MTVVSNQSGQNKRDSFPFKLISPFSSYIYQHNKPRYYKMLFLLSGKIVFTTEEDHKIIEKPALFLIKDHLRCSLKARGESKGLFFDSLIVDQLLFLCWKDKNLRSFIQECFNQKIVPSHYILIQENLSDIKDQLEWLESEWQNKQACYETEILHSIIKLFIILYRMIKPENTELTSKGWQINDLIDYIHEHYDEEFSLGDMAKKYSFSPSYFSRKFKEKTGLALFEYINHIRIQKACLFLKRSSLSIIEIAYAVGYNNLSFFNRYFRKITRMSPREYRNEIQR